MEETLDSTPKEWKGLFEGLQGKLLNAFIAGYFLFHLLYIGNLLTTRYIYLPSERFVIISGLLSLVLCCFFLPTKRGVRKKIPWYDFALAGLSFAGPIYLLTHYDTMLLQKPHTTLIVVMGITLVVVILEFTRRSMGIIVTLTLVLFFLYAMFANHAPGLFWSKGHSFGEVMAQCYWYEGGIFSGMMGRIWAKIVVGFLLFAGLIQVSGATRAILNISLGLAGHLTGGPAKVAVFASGLLGTISPAGPANVAITGSVTIPMMKKTGQTPEFAAAVESVSSSFGSLTPPIMGVLAFIIADWLRIPYYKVMLAAALPAVFYFTSLLLMVHFQALRRGIPVIPRSELPSAKLALKEGWHYALPIVVFLYYVAVLRYAPQTSIFYAIIALIVVGLFRKESRFTPKRLMIAMQQAVKIGIMIAPLYLGVGIVLASVNLTGLGIRFSAMLVEVSGGSMVTLLILAAITSFIMGMGMPMLACYFILAVLIAPALVQLGILPIAAHLFVVCAAYLHFFSPPVMPMVVIASGVAGSKIWRTAWHAMRLAIALVIVPFVFIYNPAILLQGGHGILETTLGVASCLVGVLGLAAAIQGWLVSRASWIQRLLLMASGMALILNLNIAVSIGGLCLLVLVFLWQRFTSKRQKTKPDLQPQL